jgi:hypothetical protein
MPSDAVVLDANLLVLFVVGLTSTTYIAKHKRLQSYFVRDFQLLRQRLKRAERIIATPNVLTEASNLAAQIAEPAKGQIARAFRVLLQRSDEIYVESRIAAEHPVYPRLGLADAGLLQILGDSRTLLTADLDLYLQACRQHLKAVNFTHLIAANRT